MISVVIPVKNGDGTLKKCLESIQHQTLKDVEIIILDSASTDNSRQIAESFGAKIIDVEIVTFDHGLTRNLGVKHASGEFVYLTVQDAWIAENDMLERMLQHFEDPEVLAVTGHQATPHERDKNPAKWYRRYSEYAVDIRRVTDVDAFKNLSQYDQQKLVAWDNVVAMYRRSALIELPFVQTEMSEDWIWSYQALIKGWKLIRDSSLVVYHYHHATMGYTFNTVYSLNYHFYKHFGYKPSLPKVLIPNLKASYHVVRNKELNFPQKLYWINHNFMATISNWFSNFNFLWRLKISGEKGIEKGYQKYCKEIPQGKQKIFRNG